MTTEIYYFTGTGNSLVVASGLSERLGGDLIPVASCVGHDAIRSRADVIGIVFPVYYGDAPPIVQIFARNLVSTQGVFVFTVSTYGGGIGDSANTVRRILEAHGGELSAAFGVHMHQNAFRKPWERRQGIYERSRRKVETIAERVRQKRSGMPFSDAMRYGALAPIHWMIRIMYRRRLRSSGSSLGPEAEAMIRLSDPGFQSDESCTGCGVCVQVCPVDNIRMIEGRPVWLGNCENCLACYNWCPAEAISGRLVKGGYHYRHPEVTRADMIEQKS